MSRRLSRNGHHKKHVEQSYVSAMDLAPALAERLRAAKRQASLAGAMVPNFFRQPYGPGWALVGDAGYNRDFITAQGMLDAFRDAETCAGRAGPGVHLRALVRRCDARVSARSRHACAGDV